MCHTTIINIENSSITQKFPCPFVDNPSHQPQATKSVFVPRVLPFPKCHINRIIQYVGLLNLISFTPHKAFKILPCCVFVISSFFIAEKYYTACSTILSLRAFVLFKVLDSFEESCYKYAYKFMWIWVSFFLGSFLGMGFLGPWDSTLPTSLYLTLYKKSAGASGWLSRLSVRLQLRSRSHSPWVRAPRWALGWWLRAWSLFPILCLPLSLPLPRSCSVSLCPKNK